MSKRKHISTPSDSDSGAIEAGLPYLTQDIPGVGGAIKTVPEDFFVEEIPQYPLSGEGTHVFALIEKRNMTTTDAISEIARRVGVRRIDVGYAGRKDARAVTRQWISMEHVDPEKVEAYRSRAIRVLDVRRHENKLKIGHLAGNRFKLRVRNLNVSTDEALARAQDVMETLVRVGVPNYFGPQRFGYRQDTHILGLKAVKRDYKGFFDMLLGRPELDTEEVFIKARTLYEQGDYKAAYETWLPNFRDHRYALKDLMREEGDFEQAFLRFDRQLMGLFVAAWQSELFNRVLVRRMPHIDRLFNGDMAYKHDNGACFRVEDAAVEQPRCDRFEISPTGPLTGSRMAELTDAAAVYEQPLIEALQLNIEDLQWLKHYGGRGGRRPLRFQPKGADVTSGSDEHGDYLQLRFELPSGCYATTLLRELTK
ncbi:MAG: tRNA pseudouridine(13) synthase TruD [Phycisphaerae bacterium]|nr:tRNA pseudouridine(13) synthase TruD [Phycisphaerae bacterium]